MIRLFNVYYPVRTLVLLVGEAVIVWTSFLLATMMQYGPDSWIALNVEGGYYKILAVTGVVVVTGTLIVRVTPRLFVVPILLVNAARYWPASSAAVLISV